MIDVLKYDKLIKNIAKKYCYNPNDYEDYVQEGYLVALKLLNKIEDEHLPENVIKAKLIIWVRNRLIDVSRKFKKLFLYQPFDIADRNITIQTIEFDIENSVLYVYFDIEFTQAVDRGIEYDDMSELILTGGI